MTIQIEGAPFDPNAGIPASHLRDGEAFRYVQQQAPHNIYVKVKGAPVCVRLVDGSAYRLYEDSRVIPMELNIVPLQDPELELEGREDQSDKWGANVFTEAYLEDHRPY